jgi:hypothetical protein
VEAAKSGATPGQLKAMTGDNLGTLDRFYAKSKGLTAPQAAEFSPIPRLLQSGAGIAKERAELHRLADELSLSDVRELVAQAKRLQLHTLPAESGKDNRKTKAK